MSVPDRMKQITDLAEAIVKLGEHKTVNAINTSLIKWHTGEPKEVGEYIITNSDGIVDYNNWTGTMYGWLDEVEVAAWCPISEIEPYKRVEV